MSDLFRCSECKYLRSSESACACTDIGKQEDVDFLFSQIILEYAKVLRIDRLVNWMGEKLERWGK